MRLERLAEAAHDLDAELARWHVDPHLAAGVKVVCLERPLGPVEAVIAMNPRRRRRMKAAAFIDDRYARRARRSIGRCQRQQQLAGRGQRAPSVDGERTFGTALQLV